MRFAFIFDRNSGSFFCLKFMAKHHDSTDGKIFKRVSGNGRGWVFTPSQFLDLGSRYAVDLALMRYASKGIFRKLTRGLYDYPKSHPKLGRLSPAIDTIATALKGRDSIKLQPSGAYAANLLGLSEQVPMKVVFLTDGATKKVQIHRQSIELKHTTPRNMATAGRVSGLVIQALRYLGAAAIDDQIIKQLRQRLGAAEQAVLLKDLAYAPAWIAKVIRKITGGK
ncbi:MAG: DUF6088 family protein [Verrucomicrobiales bacterium]|jgi:hypothetical protein|nr:DUF6088 family protein [Verrucomicrobiales bacterium]